MSSPVSTFCAAAVNFVRPRKHLIIASLLMAGLVVVLILGGPSVRRSVFYPKPRFLPPSVNQSTDQLLTRLKSVLQTNAPTVARSLLPGLSDAQISALETEGGFLLSDDLRALYRWHNGMPTNSVEGLLLGQRFLPLDEIVRERALVRQQLESASTTQRAAFSVLAGHRKDWITVLDDGAGDGYFYDPKRTEADGAFFHHVAEIGYYMWFPSFRNFLAGTIECYETQAIRPAADGNGFDEDSDLTRKIWGRLATSIEIGNSQ